ncbi:hypothetical protein ACHAXS_011977 [Conticribra weissflogii]
MRRLAAKVLCLITASAISSASSTSAVPSPPAGFVQPSYYYSPQIPSFFEQTKPRIRRNWNAVGSDLTRRGTVSNCIVRAHRIIPHDGKTQNKDNSFLLDQPLLDKTSETPSTAQSTNSPIIHDLPRHIAFICDGNSRWAELNSLPKSMGHAAGADRVMNILKALQTQSRWQPQQQQQRQQQQQQQPDQYDNIDEVQETKSNDEKRSNSRVEYCTLFAFSTENWARPKSEITTIMKLMERMAVQYRETAIREGNIQIKVLGDLDDERIPEGTRRKLRKLEDDTESACQKRKKQSNIISNSHDENECFNEDNRDILTICLAINYGGRADILSAVQKLAQSIASGETISSNPDGSIDESDLSKHLCTRHIPDPDLIIRTGGEKRLSNFLLWNAAYAELYFSDLLWPDFDDEALEEALLWYGTRNRRFGGRKEITS